MKKKMTCELIFSDFFLILIFLYRKFELVFSGGKWAFICFSIFFWVCDEDWIDHLWGRFLQKVIDYPFAFSSQSGRHSLRERGMHRIVRCMPTGMEIPLLKKEVTLVSSALSEIIKSSTSDWSGFIQKPVQKPNRTNRTFRKETQNDHKNNRNRPLI